MPKTNDIRINGKRLWQRLMQLAEIGATGNSGVNRQALTDGEHAAWRLLIQWGEEAGLRASTDDAANLFLTLKGANPDLPPLMAGSHLDTQPTGGKFDGAYGVIAALEAATTLAENAITPERNIIVVAWMNEEGSRFAPGMMGSAVFSGDRSIEAVRRVRDSDGISTGAEIDRLHDAFEGVKKQPIGFHVFAYIEPHIEQDVVLEREQKTIGIVTGIQGKKTFEITVSGTKGHAGTVAMAQRRDAVFAFARMAHMLEEQIGHYDADVKLTIGRVEVHPNAPSVIPDKVVFRVDLRHPDNQALEECSASLKTLCIHHASPCEASVCELVSASANTFDAELQRKIRAAAQQRKLPAMEMLSFAGHDARYLAGHCPSAMIFIPCKDGISHDESEWAEPDDVVAGAQVLLDVLNTM